MEGILEMNILQELKDLEEKEDLSVQLKQQNRPLVMWGAGEIAEEVNHYLQMNNISLADVFVDDEYYSEGELFDGKRVISCSMLEEKYTSVDVILGCSNYEKISLLEKIEVVHKVFYLFSYSYGIYNKTPLSEIEENIHEFQKIYNMLADELSCKNYLAFLKTRISGNNSYILNIFKNETNYFNNDIFHINDREVFVDIGAYDGDTIRLFLNENNGHFKYIYALEPDQTSRSMLEGYVQRSDLQNVMIEGKIPWREKGKLVFASKDNGQLSSLVFNDDNLMEGNESAILAEPLDEMFEYTEYVTLIKINYLEGAKEALQGAKNILRVHKPKLAISVGFDCTNIRSLLMLIKEINPEYKLYLRYNRGTISTLTCYGVI